MEILVEKAFEKLIEKFSDKFVEYLQGQFKWQTGMKDDLNRLQQSFPMIQAVFSTASQVQSINQDSALDKWILQLHVAIEEANALLNAFMPILPEEQPARNEEETTKCFIFNILGRAAKRIRVFCQRALKIDPDLKKLEEVLQKFDRISVQANIFLQLIKSRKQEQRELQVELREARETGYMPRNDLNIGREKLKYEVIQWLREPSNEETTTSLYMNISVLSIVGDGGSGKTTLLQHVFADRIMTYEFDLKMWVCVSDNFDVKKVIVDMLESLQTGRSSSSSSSLAVLQNSLNYALKWRRFLLVLDDVHEERDVTKLEKVLSCLSNGGLGSKILITTRKDSVASFIAKMIGKEEKALQITPISS